MTEIPQSSQATLRDVLAALSARQIRVDVHSSKKGLDKLVGTREVQKPGLALAGYLEHITPDSIQVLGETEIDYLRSLPTELQIKAIQDFIALVPSMIIIAKGQMLNTKLSDCIRQAGIPLCSSPTPTTELLRAISDSLTRLTATTVTLHGGLVDIFGVGVLIIGASGIGKSEVALDLILRGHRLVADDRVDVILEAQNTLVSYAPDITRYFMEVRGLGIINVRDLYGISAVRAEKKLELVVELIRWEEAAEMDRTGADKLFHDILGKKVPLVRLPVSPGRNIASIMEVAVRNHLLQLQGIDSAAELAQKLSRKIQYQR